MEKAEIKNLLNDLFLDASDEDLDFIVNEFKEILASMDMLDKIDTTGIEGTSWAIDIGSNYLREDIVDHQLTNDEALKNAAKTKDGYVKYVRVV